MLLNNQSVVEEIKEEIKEIPGDKSFLEKTETQWYKIHWFWYAAKAVLRGKFIVIQVYLRKQEKPQTS